MKAGRGFLVLALTLAVVILSGCAGGGMTGDVAEVQTTPLSQGDSPQVVSGLSQQPTDGPTGSLSFKIHLYDVRKNAYSDRAGSADMLSAPQVFRDYQNAYLESVQSVGASLYEKSTDQLKYVYSFPVEDGDVIVTMKELLPIQYTIVLHASATNDNSSGGLLNFFTGRADCEVKSGEDNTVVVVMQPNPTVWVNLTVKGQPGNFNAGEPIQITAVSTAADGSFISTLAMGYFDSGNLHLSTYIQLYPSPATSLQISYNDHDSHQPYAQAINFNILELIDGIQKSGSYEVDYQPAGNLNVEVVWPGQGLTVAKFSGYNGNVYVPCTNDAKLASAFVGANQYEGADINTINVYLSEANASVITRLYLVDHDTDAVIGGPKNNISTENNFAVSFINSEASKGRAVDLYGDVRCGAPAGTWVANVSAEGVGLISATSLSGGSATNAMQTINIVEHGELFVANGAQPNPAILIGGTTGNYVAQFTFSAAYEGYTIDRLKLKTQYYFCFSTTGIAIKYKDKAGIWQQSSQAWYVPSGEAEECTATFTGLTWYIPANGSANLDDYIDMATIANGAFSGAVGAITFLHDQGFRAIGDSGNLVTSVGDHDLSGNSFIVRKSKPTITMLDAGTDPTASLFSFSVAADSAGSIDIKQLGFYFIPKGCEIKEVYLYDSEVGFFLNDLPVDPVDSTNSGVYVVRLPIGSMDFDEDPPRNVVEIMHIGTMVRTFKVRGTVTGYNPAAGDSITVGFAQDVGGGIITADIPTVADEGANLIWSDRSASARTIFSEDWTDGGLLKEMTGVQYFGN